MNAALCSALAFSFSAAVAGTADCRPCHAAIVDSFLRTGMGRSIAARPVLPEGSFYHRLSNRHYEVAGGAMRRYQLSSDGAGETNRIEKKIDLAIGSGNHAVTYVHRTPEGRLIELPLTRYAERGGFWAMSPGYDRPDHLDFRREVAEACLFCHSASTTPSPIDCSRCHGPVEAHLAKPQRGSILNPARLPAQRQLEICLQCHLETASSGFPDSLRKPGRAVFSYRPGEPLADYKVYFDRADGAERFEINHAGYRLMQSRCFVESKGRMTCTSCHDPHAARARNTCSTCHGSEHARASTGCAGCHMPARRTGDAIHVRMTDHLIARKPALAEPEGENRTPYDGDLRVFFGSGLLDLARVKHVIDSGRGKEADYRRWVALEPDSAPALAALGEALMRFGKRNEAWPVLRRARRADPRNVTVLNAVAVYRATEGKLDEALGLLKAALRENPEHPLTLINLGVTYEAQGRATEAASAYREAIRAQPDSAEARRRLGALQSVRSYTATPPRSVSSAGIDPENHRPGHE